MDIQNFLQNVTAIPGLPGMERPVSEFIADQFEPFADDISIDVMNNVIARVGFAGPRIMVSAHLDEIGMIVTKIEDDGCIRMTYSGGVDPRILPALEVSIQTANGPLYGVVGAKAPHVSTAEERKKTLEFHDLYVDVGYDAETVRQKVRIGDPIVMLAKPEFLANEHIASKTMDDRASVAVMLMAAEYMKGLRVNAQTFFVSSAQEEVGAFGAKTSGHALDPDIAIALDMTHGEGPGTGKFEAFPLDKVVLTTGPAIHPALLERIKKTAEEHRVEYAIEVSNGPTWTDADVLQLARAGVPTLLISVPARYMHTTVETLSMNTLKEAGRLLALFIADIAREWESLTWY